MKKILFIGVMALATLCSCTTVKKTSYIAEVQTAVVQYPTVTELEVMEQATATVEWGWNPFKRMSLETRKGNLVANLLKAKGADVLLEEQFVFESDGFGGGTLTVTGYPAKFKGFRKATEADLDALRAANPGIYNVSKSRHK